MKSRLLSSGSRQLSPGLQMTPIDDAPGLKNTQPYKYSLFKITVALDQGST
jgi:hypothetical protein